MPAPGPFLSVIMATRNPGAQVLAALESVWSQKGVSLELIVVDGGSTDGTVALLQAESNRIAVLLTGPDNGLYEAMNKAIGRASGEWLYFLGADDRLVGDRVLSEVYNWSTKTEAGVMTGEIAYNDGRIYKMASRVNTIARNFVHHQATFYRRSLFLENGTFDASFTVMGDYEFNIRLWKSHIRFKSIPIRVCACGTGGLSDSGAWLGYSEEIRVRHKYFDHAKCWIWDLTSVLRWMRKRLASKPRTSRG